MCGEEQRGGRGAAVDTGLSVRPRRAAPASSPKTSNPTPPTLSMTTTSVTTSPPLLATSLAPPPSPPLTLAMEAASSHQGWWKGSSEKTTTTSSCSSASLLALFTTSYASVGVTTAPIHRFRRRHLRPGLPLPSPTHHCIASRHRPQPIDDQYIAYLRIQRWNPATGAMQGSNCVDVAARPVQRQLQRCVLRVVLRHTLELCARRPGGAHVKVYEVPTATRRSQQKSCSCISTTHPCGITVQSSFLRKIWTTPVAPLVNFI
ncbi:hypothetical protein Cni_G05833 [Canna indica]|uniref:Uncharacterized protein n=1 Tax=Canna indica TaxID=4628 RepID=A0AAQ3Q3J5_9LILI|nr:hypothetical protein Cni_G05833 [Canna indica]